MSNKTRLVAKEKTAPLVEVIFEIRWGSPSRPDEGVIQFDFDEEEITLFAGLFRANAEDKYPHYRKVNEALPMNVPHGVKHQFWTGENKWPCLQVGLGIMTANLTNDDYSWDLFKQTCMAGLGFLDKAHHKGLDNLPAIGVELRYQDGFLLADQETDDDFVKNKAQITFDTPPDFLESDLLESVVSDHHVVFSVPVVTPKGELINKLDRGLINGKPGFIQSTTLRSADALKPEISMDALDLWLEAAHAVQQHAYKTLILPTHERIL